MINQSIKIYYIIKTSKNSAITSTSIKMQR